ncbi:NADP-dependent alcohol dehydrogenase 6 [Trametes pubescens]|uniref:NADP-dependent alcohol dehydrogenase 6 n=1 Tax=Trametes pubescens TaxID=154538 RepID=A0A1M2VBZ6_TRAPU|nr:NADP-dependent alcohol dehydrogenase 6 [Trametes pubescens]
MPSKTVVLKGYAMTDPSKWNDLKVIEFKPKTFAADDVEVAITHCGVCGSDVHTLTQGWGESKLPLVVGHEIVGTVARVGDKVTEFKIGDRVGVGAQRGSCLECRECKDDYENYCPQSINTYDAEYPDGVVAQGGYSTAIRAQERFVFPIPDEIESRDAASMMCAGLTVYSPLKTHGVGPGKSVGIMGIGGLGHYAILWAKAMGAEVYAFTHDDSKMEDIKKMGADHIVDTGKKDFHKDLARKLDVLLSTRDMFGDKTSLDHYLSMLYVHGVFVTVGLPDADDPLPSIHAFDLVPTGCLLGGSKIGSKKECLEMLELARSKGIKPWIEELPMSQAGKALQDLKDNKVRYRYVLTQDIA